VRTITDLTVSAKQAAQDVVVRHKRKSSFRLYSVLAQCMEIVERCKASHQDHAEVHALFKQQEANHWVFADSDIFVLVCRYVFAGTYSSNSIRYSQALREAHKLNISSDKLAAYMKRNGGVNALYFRRPLEQRSMKTKTLRLNESISFSRDAPLTLTLRWRDDNTFDVVERI
jgi:hypothetical protein